MNSDMILAIFEAFIDPRNVGKHTCLDYSNALQARNALAQHFQEIAKQQGVKAEPPKAAKAK
jgi:hypothetical protein